MKKIFAVVITALMVSLAGCGLNSSENSGNVNVNQGSTSSEAVEETVDITEIAGPKTLKFMEEYNDEDGYSMTCTAGAAGKEIKLFSAVKGGNSYVMVEQEENSYIVIAKGENMYMLVPSSKIAYSTQINSAVNVNYMDEAEKMINGSEYKEGEITIDGVKYQYESYGSDIGEVKYCFLEDEFRYLTVDTNNQYIAIKIDDLTKDVDESLFEIPEDYKIK